MPRGTGSPKIAFVQAEKWFTPDDIGLNATAYNSGGTNGNSVDVAGYGVWSVYVLVTAGGNSTIALTVMEETSEANVLCTVTLSAAVTAAAGVQQFVWGPVGSAAAIVPARLVRLVVTAAPAQNGVATCRMFGRAY